VAKGVSTVSARPFLKIESMLQEELHVKTSLDRKAHSARLSSAPSLEEGLLREGVVEDAIECVGMLNKRKAAFEEQMAEALEWRALLLKQNAHLKQTVRCNKPTNYVMLPPPSASRTTTSAAGSAPASLAAHTASHRPQVPASRIIVDQHSGVITTVMDASFMHASTFALSLVACLARCCLIAYHVLHSPHISICLSTWSLVVWGM